MHNAIIDKIAASISLSLVLIVYDSENFNFNIYAIHKKHIAIVIPSAEIEETPCIDIGNAEITKNIRAGFNVYADATHLNEKSRYKLLHGLHNRGCNPSEIVAIYFDVPLEVCKERNNLRLGTKTYVPEEQILKMYSAYTHPHKYEGFSNIYRIDEDGYVEEEEE